VFEREDTSPGKDEHGEGGKNARRDERRDRYRHKTIGT
jgi:hypothetical protein